MKKRTFTMTVVISFGTLFFCSCDDNEIVPVSTVISGTVTAEYHSGRMGFSFDRGDTVSVPMSSPPNSSWSDFQFVNQIDAWGKVLGVALMGGDPFYGDDRPTFHFVKFTSSIDSAKALFQSLSEVSDSTFETTASGLTRCTILTVKTLRNKFAKMLIRENIVSSDSSYATITFDWVYQSNGSRKFI